MKRLILFMMVLALLGGCTKRAWYEGMKAGQRNECSKLEGDKREKCLQNAEMGYKEYEDNRK